MTFRPYPDYNRALRQVQRHALESSSTPMRAAEAAWAALPTINRCPAPSVEEEFASLDRANFTGVLGTIVPAAPKET